VSSSFDDDGITLPPDVVLPPSVTPQVLAGKPKKMLLELPRESMIQALAEFDAAVMQKGSEIRSLSAYFVGVIKRYKMIQQGGRGPGELSDRVLARLERLVNSGYCTQAEIDGQLKSKLTMLSEEDALSAIDEMNLIERSEIRQFASYFMGIMNRYAKTRHANDKNINNNNFSNNRDKQRQRDNNQDYRERRIGSTNEKYSHYGRGNGDNGVSSKHGKDSNRGAGPRRSSRDRYDRHDRHRRRSSRSYSSSSSRSRSRSRSRERRRRRRSRSDSRDRDDYRSRRSHRDRGSRMNQRLSPPENLSRSMFPPPSGQSIGFPPPPPPPPRPATMNGPPPSMPMSQLAPGRVHHPTMQQLASATTQGHSTISNFQRTNDQQLQQLFQQPHPPNLTPQNQQITLPANLSQQQIQALQAILQQSPTMQQPAAPGSVSRWSSQASSQVPTQSWQHPTQVPRTTWPTSNHDPSPLDIMGLADKAAQALSGQLSSHPHVSISSNSIFPPNPPTRTVTEKDLPQLVQYAIQNLRVSGHINETSLDPFVCDMLKKIPEQNALLALETFSVCDVSKMRNKVAYLYGILKKEIVKLGLQ
ncbi:hypothetical protein ACHAWX_005677, partial [Stephanocyclus meneghinianus]